MTFDELKEDDEFQRLTDAVKTGNVTAFVGAGLSRPDCPTWAGLVEEIAKDTGRGDYIERAKGDANEWLGLLDDIRKDRQSSIDGRIRALADVQLRDDSNYRHLAASKIQRFITTNYDHLLEHALIDGGGKITVHDGPLQPLRFDRVGNLAYLHGKAQKSGPLRIVLSGSDYKEAYVSPGFAKVFLQAHAIEKNLVFIGFSFQDLAIREILRVCDEALRGAVDSGLGEADELPRWWILLPSGASLPADTSDMQCLTPVFYDNADTRHTTLTAVLRYWARGQSQRARLGPDPNGRLDFTTQPGVPR